jgi:NAD dependent epimerase/dehydratase family enzyme
MRIFITGGTGLIGPRLIQRLHERRDQVILLTRRPTELRNRFSYCTRNEEKTNDEPRKTRKARKEAKENRKENVCNITADIEMLSS